jgi:flavodoxin/ferredoxin
MKCIVIYFSQTGNTEKVAKAIGAGVKQAAGNCDILPIKEVNPRRLYQYDLIGLGCPVIGFVEPVNVQAFIKDMRFVGGKHAFPFATHGTRPEFFFPSIVPKLKGRGLIVVGMYNCYADAYMSGRAGVYPTAGHPDEIDLKEATAFGREMVEHSRRISAGETNLIPPLPAWVEYDVKEYIRNRQIREQEMGVPVMTAKRRMTIKFQKEKCLYPKCRLCMDNCPVDGIDLSVKPPVIAKPCMTCMFCAMICPTGALIHQMGEGGGWGTTPEAKAIQKAVFEEFYLKPLAKAEAEGRFRRLVPATAHSMERPPGQADKHPQFIIGKGLA